jgi:rhamnose transport system ATP-binding protein
LTPARHGLTLLDIFETLHAGLGGGNQQKVVLAKWLGRHPSLLIVDEPTRGIDIATKAEVHGLLAQLAAEGVAILMISSELPEVLQNGDRILVMREGRLTPAGRPRWPRSSPASVTGAPTKGSAGYPRSSTSTEPISRAARLRCLEMT